MYGCMYVQYNTTIRWRNSRITSAMKRGPLSDRSWWGAPKRPKCLRRHSAADNAVASVVWYNSTQRVKVSTITRINPCNSRKWTDEIDIQSFHWSVCRGCETMSMNGDFQQIHFLTTRTMINEISNMLSLILPSVIQILEMFKCTFKSIMANNCVVQHANFGLLRWTRFIWLNM